MRRPVLITTMVLVGLALLVVGLVFPFWQPWVWRWQGVAALTTANDEEALREAVGRYGAFIPLQDGTWIAIRYKDSHSGGVWSLAIARDSGGKWFKSNHHFCGELRFFDSWIRAQGLPPDNPERYQFESTDFGHEHGDLRDIYNAPTLDEARAALLRASFEEFD